MVSPSEEFGLGTALAQMDAMNAPRNAVLKGSAGIVMAARATKTPLSDVFSAMAQGSEDEGDKLLLETMALAHKYIGSWATLAVFGLGLYQAGKSAVTIAEWLFGLAKKLGGMVTGVTTKVMAHDAPAKSAESPGGEALSFLVEVLAGKLPLLATLLSAIASGPPSSPSHDNGEPLPIDPANWSRRGAHMDEEVIDLSN